MGLHSADNKTPNSATHRVTVRIANRLGLHLRPAAQLVKLAGQYQNCEICLSKDGQQVNAKSIMGVIMLAAEQGCELVIEATGAESAEAISTLEQLVASGFGEE